MANLPPIPEGFSLVTNDPPASKPDLQGLPPIPEGFSIVSQPNQDLETGGAVGVTASLGSGIAKGVVGMLGLLGDFHEVAKAMPWAPKRSMYDRVTDIIGHSLPTSSDMVKYAAPYVPVLNEQATTPGQKYAEAVGEFLPMASAGGGGVNTAKSVLGKTAAEVGADALNATKYAVAPAITTEWTRQQVEKGNAPAWAPAAVGLLTVGAGHGAHKFATPQNSAKEAVRSAFSGVTDESLIQAEGLMNDARANGIGLTWSEALQHVTGGTTNGANLQRVIEGQGGLQDFMGKRPEQIRQANERMFASISEAPSNPSNIGPQVGQAADNIIQDARDIANTRTAPRYKAAEADTVPASEMSKLKSDSLFLQTLKEVRSDPSLNKTVSHLPDNNPVVLDLVQRRLGEKAGNAVSPVNPSTSYTRAENFGETRGNVRAVADAASPELAGARATNSVLRDIYLKPLLEGPIGKLAGKDTTTKAAVDALFPSNPLPNSAGEISDAVSELSTKNPWAARQIVRSHIEGTFNQATKDLQTGANEFGGASFRAKLVGNAQQAENLAASIKALPGGDNILRGFDRLMSIMEATGQRQKIGSQTAFNQEALANLKSGSLVGEAISTGGIKLPQRIKEKLQAWNLGQNVDEVARLLSDPKAAEAFKQLVSAKKSSFQEVGALVRLTQIASKPVAKQKR